LIDSGRGRGGVFIKFQFYVDGPDLIGRMRTSPAVPGVSGVVGESGEARNFARKLDVRCDVLHNLASLLQTKRKRRRGGKEVL
jgi:hypothetical protein